MPLPILWADYAIPNACPNQSSPVLFLQGTVAKSEFQDDGLVLRLLREEIVENVENDPDRVRFDVSMANEGQLRERFEQLEGIEIGPILAIWQQSLKRALPAKFN